MTKRQIQRLYDRCLDLDASLAAALGTLGKAASEIIGEELRADLCEGGEIEFRHMVGDYVDDYDCVRLEDILSKMER